MLLEPLIIMLLPILAMGKRTPKNSVAIWWGKHGLARLRVLGYYSR